MNYPSDLNGLERYPRFKNVQIVGATNGEMEVVVKDSYADHPLVTGPQYIYDDIKLEGANFMTTESSGVLIFGVNHGTKFLQDLRGARLTKFYKLKGVLGQARVGNFSTGKIVEKSTWRRIKREQIDRVCSMLQGTHQRKMFEYVFNSILH